MSRTAPDLDPGRRHRGKAHRVVGRRQDRLGEIAPDLAPRDVERGDAFDVADPIAAEIRMHQTGDRVLAGGGAVELDPLDQRRGAVADADDRHPDFCHRKSS
jgi:hypothetical protein